MRPAVLSVAELVTVVGSRRDHVDTVHDAWRIATASCSRGELVGTVDKNAVTKDEVLAMIIMGKKPGEATTEEMAELHG